MRIYCILNLSIWFPSLNFQLHITSICAIHNSTYTTHMDRDKMLILIASDIVIYFIRVHWASLYSKYWQANRKILWLLGFIAVFKVLVILIWRFIIAMAIKLLKKKYRASDAYSALVRYSHAYEFKATLKSTH